MLFTDSLYLPFLTAVFLLWLPLGARGRKLELVAASALFYGLWDPRFLALLAFVWLVIYAVPLAMAGAGDDERKRSRWLAAGVISLLTLLFVFKYLGFFLDAAGPLLRLLGAAEPPRALRLLMPVGISFYTFQAISYLVDCRRRRLEPSRSLLDTALYASFFPMLLAGPIEKGARWLPQIQARQPFRWENFAAAVERLLLGYFLKVGIADTLAPFCDDIFARSGSAGAGELWVGAVAYSVQILTDFAGYSMIARGSAKLFGYEVVNNFAQPYFSRTFSEFWRRWHISLSSWIWEYLFNPLMSACLRLVGRLNLRTVEQEMRLAYPGGVVATMLLCGLWHGAGWTYVVWGGLHGVFLWLERAFFLGKTAATSRRRPAGWKGRAREGAASALVFLLVTLAWVVFRSGSLGEAGTYLTRMFAAAGWVVQKKLLVVLAAAAAGALVVELAAWRRGDEWAFRAAGRWRGLAWAAAVVYVIVFGSLGGQVPFIYFQF